MSFKEWLKLLTPDPHHHKGVGEDVADTIGLIVVMALVMFIILVG